MDSRDQDKKLFIMSSQGNRVPQVSLDTIKSRYIAEGKSADEIAKEYYVPVSHVQQIIAEHNLPELRKAYIREGVEKLQNVQLQQSHKLMDIELNFKKLRIVQLESQLNDFLAYYSRHGDFYKRHPVSQEILKDTNGIPMQIKIPDVSREISQLKEAVTMSEGLRQMLTRLDDILNKNPERKPLADPDVIELNDTEFDSLFEAGSKE